ncbi:LAME_0H17062g1_1 [Lachancea meyersii CBS 8951]|uniref:LAME_0H17062g1_1 n=1 Tax=Lachancea meyersii CBS 8951 TaxID=1266667 RepID=A0A1G4KIP0_9SACH|nr:LAME_0H17062g1_1 [Lachancea meyersii CBS 8951]
MSKQDMSQIQEERRKRPQEYMNDYLSDNNNDNRSQVSRENGSLASRDNGSSQHTHSNHSNSNNNNNDDRYIPSRDFAPQHRISASASYVPRQRSGTTKSNSGEDNNYPVAQVAPNTQQMMRSNSAAHSTGHRNRAQSGVSTSNMNLRSLRSNTNNSGAQGIDQPDATDDPRDPDVPLNIKPKTLYQNPQTPTVLPSTYHPINTWSTLKQTYLKEFLAEFMGTMVMIFFGCTVICQVRAGQQQQRVTFLKQLAGSTDVPAENKIELLQYLMPVDVTGTFDDIALIWGGAVVMGYFAAGGSALSGGHLNPALTLSNCVYRGFPWRKVPIYWAGQMLGAYIGALVVFMYYMPVIQYVYPDWNGNETVLSMFCTYPLEYLTSSRQFVSELVCSAVLQISMFALTDPYTCLRSDLFPLMLFVLIYCLIGATSLQTGAGLNPARDLGPRLALATVGFESKTLWKGHHHYFWVPIVAPFVGVILGGFIYDICIYQGHESFLNWPWSLVRRKVRRLWTSRPRFYKRENDDNQSNESDWDYDNESNQNSNPDTEFDEHPKTGFFTDSDPQIQKQVQFKSMSRNFNGVRNPVSGIPTIFEEGGDDEDEDGDDDDEPVGDNKYRRPSLAKKKTKSNERKAKKN